MVGAQIVQHYTLHTLLRVPSAQVTNLMSLQGTSRLAEHMVYHSVCLSGREARGGQG
jgi:hypothetical protein